MIGSDKSATRFAGQIGNISQFLPQGEIGRAHV